MAFKLARGCKFFLYVAGVVCMYIGSGLHASDALQIDIVYLEREVERPNTLSTLISWPEDAGEQGAALGIADSNTTGKFLKHDYVLKKEIADTNENAIARAKETLGSGPTLAVLNVDYDTLTKIAQLPETQDDLLFNAGSANDTLRKDVCLPNVLHTLPSRGMLTDALMQFLSKRRWSNILLLQGNKPGDTAYADAARGSARKFGLRIVHEQKFLEDADLRRNAAAEMPVLTQAKDYDFVLVADEARDFGPYVLYNTWLPRPVGGTVGIVPQAWHSVVEQWGAAQLQSRFLEQAQRPMQSLDYAAWAAVRSIGEAVTRIGSTDVTAIKEFIYSDQFALAGFKGAKMTYRSWNGQLRHPIPLAHASAVVALAPIEGFMHQHTELDTLGVDKPESGCNNNS